MAAGIPILANTTKFVQRVIETSASGMVVNFSHPATLVNAINQFASDIALRQRMGKTAQEYFKNQFNWNLQSHAFYQALVDATATRPLKKLQLFPKQYNASIEKAETPIRSVHTPIAHPFSLRRQVKMGLFAILRIGWRFTPLFLQRRLKPLARKLFQIYDLT